MTQPSNLKVKRLVELDALPDGAASEAWMYAVQNNKDYKIDLDKLRDTISARDFVSEASADATEQVRELHLYANEVGKAVSYQGVTALYIQADAQIVINTDVDFADCEFRLLNGVVPDPDWTTHQVLFRIRDDATPYSLTTISKADCSLRKGEHLPFGANRPAGFYNLGCDYLISNRAKDGTSWYEQTFRLDTNGVTQFPLSADVSSASSVTVRHRANPVLGPIALRGGRFRSDDFNHLIAFNIERNQVRLSGIRMQDYAVEPTWEDITSFIRIDNAADIDIEDLDLPGRTSWVSGVEVSGAYLINPDGAANLRINNVRATNRNSVLASNRVNGMFVSDSVLNRVDVHFSGHNVFVRDTVLFRRGIGIGWGGGKIYAHNVTTYNSPVFTDREDYGGSFFGGDVSITGCTLYGDYRRTAFVVELCAFTHVAEGLGVGSTVNTFMPDSVVIRDCVRRAPLPAGGNQVVGGLRMYTHASRADLGRVYAPARVLVDNIRMEGISNNYRNGNMIALREMWPNVSGDCLVTISNCPGFSSAMTAFNTAGKTLNTGTATLASANAPTQAQAAKIRGDITNCGFVAIECTVTGGELSVNRCSVQRIMCTSTDAGQRQSLAVNDCRLVAPILEGAETTGQARGYNPNAFSPVTFSNVVVLGNFDLSGASALQGVMSAISATVVLPAGVTADTAVSGWRNTSLFH